MATIISCYKFLVDDIFGQCFLSEKTFRVSVAMEIGDFIDYYITENENA
jgi:hypothetical protein